MCGGNSNILTMNGVEDRANDKANRTGGAGCLWQCQG